MPLLTVKPSGKTYEAQQGSTLLAALQGIGEPIEHKCEEGKPLCGSCHIFIQEGRKSVSRIAALENAKLDTLVGIGSKSRLACQVIIGAEDITVELLSFSSGL